MSRTTRKPIYNKAGLRNPKTFSEIKLLNQCKNDPDAEEYLIPISARYHRYIPASWDDLFVSSLRTLKWRRKNKG